jgi:hypothetical protein
MMDRTRGRLAAAAAATAAAAAAAGLAGAGAASAKEAPRAGAAQGGGPVVLGAGSLGALTARGNTAYAVLEPAEFRITLVRSNGRTATRAVRFGGTRAEFPDIAAGPGGIVAAWGGRASGGQQWFAASTERLRRDQHLGFATAPPKVAVSGSDWLFAGTDFKGDITLVRSGQGDNASHQALTSSGPFERHRALDLDVHEGNPLVLDLVQTRSTSVLQVVGGPTAPVVRRGRLETIEGTLAVDGDTVRVAYIRGGRAYLATADIADGARWRTRRLGGPGRGAGQAAVVAGGQVLYTQRGRGGQDVYYFDGRRVRRLTNTTAGEEEPMLAADGNRVFAAWTEGGRRTRAILRRLR